MQKKRLKEFMKLFRKTRKALRPILLWEKFTLKKMIIIKQPITIFRFWKLTLITALQDISLQNYMKQRGRYSDAMAIYKENLKNELSDGRYAGHGRQYDKSFIKYSGCYP